MLAIGFFVVALIYSAVGFGGGSTYIALLALTDHRAEVIWRPPGEAAAMMQLPFTSSDHTFRLRSPVVAKIFVNIGFLERKNAV